MSETDITKELNRLIDNMDQCEIDEAIKNAERQVKSQAPLATLVELLLKKGIISSEEYRETEKEMVEKIYVAANNNFIKYREDVLTTEEIHPGAKLQMINVYNGVIAGIDALILENKTKSDKSEEVTDVVST